ncbi:hypothetical protein EP10_001204 [Geobacillus icigianus]|uniref:Uncharacterized protein n=1 Tax=Geobacillus icigianus TaxID=1430331 RepID=A0ABU6BEJ8_9BACL|nr:hypothetical protein [Geobacillus icigianus]
MTAPEKATALFSAFFFVAMLEAENGQTKARGFLQGESSAQPRRRNIDRREREAPAMMVEQGGR